MSDVGNFPYDGAGNTHTLKDTSFACVWCIVGVWVVRDESASAGVVECLLLGRPGEVIQEFFA